ncbi:MAG: molybdopterin-dependent oxidoreductase [Steroidobacteraceae bacterium]
MKEVPTFCRICEPMCPLIATVDGTRVTKLAPDQGHPVSKGFACHKGLSFDRVNGDPDRVLHPLKRVAGGVEQISWNAALDAIAARIFEIRDRHGPDAIAVYNSNPFAFNSAGLLTSQAFCQALGTRSVFSAGTQDTSNKFAANAELFGSSQLLIPDIYNTDYFMCLGANPRVSHWTTVSSPHPFDLLRDLKQRAVPVRMINPRHTETARWIGCETELVHPDTDVYLLAAMLEAIHRFGLADETAIAEWGSNIDGLWAFVSRYSAERVANVVGLSQERIETLAREFATAASASIYMATGVNQGTQGTLAYWLLTMMSLTTGNLGRKGGNYYARGPIETCAPLPRLAMTRRDTAAGEIYSVMGWMPANLLPELIEAESSPLRVLIVLGGNPLLTTGGGSRLAASLGRLELLVVVELFATTIAAHADYVLPATSWLERGDINLISLGVQPEPYVCYMPPVVEPLGEARNEAWMLGELGKRLQLPGFDGGGAAFETGAIDALLKSANLTVAALSERPRGVCESEQADRAAATHAAILHADGKVDCCPTVFDDELLYCEERFKERQAADARTLRVISRRTHKSHNTNQFWRMKSIGESALEAGEVSVHPRTAEALDLGDGDRVVLASATGRIEAILRLDGHLKQGVVALGHGTPRGATSTDVTPLLPGVNTLTPGGQGSFERLSNMAHFAGIEVSMCRAEELDAAMGSR